MEEFKELERKSTILFMKVNLKMTFIMDMVDTFMPTVAITLEIGSMAKDLDGENTLINLEKFKKVCGSIQNS
jgi:stage III sporulation protein SpoIIIAA